MHPRRQPAPPLNPVSLRALALHYVGRFATTRGKLAIYLRRKVRERGWSIDEAPDIQALVEEFAERAYVNDQSYAEEKTAALKRRGMGAFRIKAALQDAGIENELVEGLTHISEDEGQCLALDFARRRRIGPYAISAPDDRLRKRWMAAFMRAGHSASNARLILSMQPLDIPRDQTF